MLPLSLEISAPYYRESRFGKRLLLAAEVATVDPSLPARDPYLLPTIPRIGQECDVALVGGQAYQHLRLRRGPSPEIQAVARGDAGHAVERGGHRRVLRLSSQPVSCLASTGHQLPWHSPITMTPHSSCRSRLTIGADEAAARRTFRTSSVRTSTTQCSSPRITCAEDRECIIRPANPATTARAKPKEGLKRSESRRDNMVAGTTIGVGVLGEQWSADEKGRKSKDECWTLKWHRLILNG
nr:hypothetical protein RTCK_02395 [Rhizobium sp. TCK]